MDYFLKGKSALYASQKIGVNRHTAEKYYRKFNETQTEERGDYFIKTQVASKEQYLYRMDELEDKIDAQIIRMEGLVGDDDTGLVAERILQKSITDAANLADTKTAMKFTPTLGLQIRAEVEKRNGEINKDTSISKLTSNKRSTKD